jgi:DNA-binding NarL/FixJ family response regulator
VKPHTDHSAVIIDCHPLWLDALASLLERLKVGVVASSTNRSMMASLADEHEPDLLVVGLESTPSDVAFLEELGDVLAANQETKAIVVSSTRDRGAIDAAFAAGATAYCMKSAEPEDLQAAIRQAFEHSIYVAAPRHVSPHPLENWNAAAQEPELTKRETEILRLVAEGHSNSQLARMLWVTEQTVKFHLSNIYRKLDVANRTEASRWAQLHGLLAAEVTVNAA